MQRPSKNSSLQKKTPIPQNEQSTRFIEIARALGADEDEAAFKEKLAVIARQKQKPDQEKANGDR